MRKLIVTFFGCGYLPIAPGSWGSLAAAGIFVLMVYLVPGNGAAVDFLLAALTMLATAGGLALGRWAIQAFANKDPRPFVLDEAAGMWLALLALPYEGLKTAAIVAAVQFLLFRIADIVKIPPAKQLERLADGWGIVADDLAAGIWANIFGQIIFRWGILSGILPW